MDKEPPQSNDNINGIHFDIDGYSDNIMHLEQLCCENSEYFKNDYTEKGQRLYEAFNGLIGHTKTAKVLIRKIRVFVHEYDFDEKTPGNGYRSFITVAEACINHSINTARTIQSDRKSIFFRKGLYMKEIEACNHFLASVCTCLEYLLILRQWSLEGKEKGDLFCDDKHSVEELFQYGNAINQYCFYGRCLGIQYSETIRGVLRFLSICMAGFSESYYSQAGRVAKATSSVWTSGKYFWNPELRSRRIVNISQYAGVDFCKSFWFLAESELMRTIPSIVGSSVKINKIVSIPPENLVLKNVLNGDVVTIPIPTSHLGPGPVFVRLLSFNIKEGMLGEVRNSKRVHSPSRNLIFHCHGGGFVAQSSKSHELYLRDWAVALNAPIVSVDYSLAPQAPFPRALEEVFYAYCWIIKNHSSFGWTGENIILAGDSAGANLCIGCTIKSIELQVRRPDGLFLAYCPVLVDFIPSPARMLCLMDPLLPFGFMMRCLKAYASPSESILKTNAEQVKNLEEIRNAHQSNMSYILDNSVISNRKNSRTSITISPSENSSCLQDGFIPSPLSDNTSDTFASASYQSQIVENTDLLTPENGSSDISFEDDSQPVIHMVTESREDKKGKSPNNSESYVSTFIENYVIETPENKAQTENYILKPTITKTSSEEDVILATGREVITTTSLQQRLNKTAEGLVNIITATLGKLTASSEIIGSNSLQFNSSKLSKELHQLDALIARSPSDEFIFQLPKDPYLSPYWAHNDTLAQFPPTKVLTIDMDPCLDDCVMFAKKLKKLGIDVSIDILKGLPHGFLNFTMLSTEAMKGSKMCIERISQLFDLKKT